MKFICVGAKDGKIQKARDFCFHCEEKDQAVKTDIKFGQFIT